MKARVMISAAWLMAGALLGPAAAQSADDKKEEQREAARTLQRAARDAARAARDTEREVRRNVFVSSSGGSFLGIGAAEIDSERAKALKLREERGVEVKSVEPESPAAKAGFKEGDVVLEYNGQRVEGTEQFMRLVRETPPGRQVRLVISRGGTNQTLTATLAKRKSGFTFAGPDTNFEFHMPDFTGTPIPPMPPDVPRAFMGLRSARLGIESETLTSQLAEYFGVKEGVLIRSVTAGSAAEKAGLKAGDVIVKVDDQTVTSPREITSTLRGIRSKKTLPIGIYRDRKPMTLNVTIELPGSAMSFQDLAPMKIIADAFSFEN